MALVRLRGPLKQLAGGQPEHPLDGRTVRELLRELERSREGDDRVTELVVGTRRGLFVLEGDPGGAFDVRARAFAGEPVEYAMRDPRTGRLLASVTSAFYGPKIWHADDASGEWRQAEGIALPEDGDAALERIWVITAGADDGTLYAGGDPGVLFESRDGGETWELNRALWSTRRDPHGSRAAAACACTPSSRGRGSRAGSRSASQPSASG